MHAPESQIIYPPELPVSAARDEIMRAISDNQVVIVAGATGSGKTTQLPKMCLELGRTAIAHTQPRRLAARTIAERIAEELGVEVDIVNYIKTPPDAATLRSIVAKLEDEPTALVRRDSMWKKLGLTEDDAVTEDQIVALLVKHKQLLQRPVVVTADTAIIGRPKERVTELLAPLASRSGNDAG